MCDLFSNIETHHTMCVCRINVKDNQNERTDVRFKLLVSPCMCVCVYEDGAGLYTAVP